MIGALSVKRENNYKYLPSSFCRTQIVRPGMMMKAFLLISSCRSAAAKSATYLTVSGRNQLELPRDIINKTGSATSRDIENDLDTTERTFLVDPESISSSFYGLKMWSFTTNVVSGSWQIPRYESEKRKWFDWQVSLSKKTTQRWLYELGLLVAKGWTYDCNSSEKITS